MSFRHWQPDYAAHGVATFPVRIGPDGKQPMVKHYGRFGLRASAQIAGKFPDASAFGFMLGKPSKITVLDVDSPNTRVLADAIDRHGATPIIVRSGSGNHQAWYRWNGERRRIRPDRDPAWPVDILGGGYVVGPPSRGIKSNYQFIEGGLDDLDRLPILRGIDVTPSLLLSASMPDEVITVGHRNAALWRHCMRSACHCDDFDAVLDVAQTRNDQFMPPLSNSEVMKIARSAWIYTERGENRFGRYAAVLDQDHVDRLVRDPDVLALVIWLKAHNRPGARFWVADGLTSKLGWSLHRLREARRRAVDAGEIECVRSPQPGAAAEYVFRAPLKSRGNPQLTPASASQAWVMANQPVPEQRSGPNLREERHT